MKISFTYLHYMADFSGDVSSKYSFMFAITDDNSKHISKHFFPVNPIGNILLAYRISTFPGGYLLEHSSGEVSSSKLS